MKGMLDKGCRRFAWIDPHENVPGHTHEATRVASANGDDEQFGHGAFAYTFDDPDLDCYFPVKAITPVVRRLAKPFEKWDVKEVCGLVESIGFAEAADVIKQNCVDGKTLISADFDQYLTMGIAEGGLGLKPSQKKDFKTEIEKIQKQWDVKEVCGLVESIGFAEAADVIKQNCVDGKTLISADFDQYLTMGIAEGGLGLKPMQKIRFKTEIEQYCVKKQIS